MQKPIHAHATRVTTMSAENDAWHAQQTVYELLEENRELREKIAEIKEAAQELLDAIGHGKEWDLLRDAIHGDEEHDERD